MNYYLSETTKKLITENGIRQQELVKKIDELHNGGKVPRKISQQSLSRYLNGLPFPKKDTEEIILKGVSSIVGARKFRVLRKLYKVVEKEQKERQEIVSADDIKRVFLFSDFTSEEVLSQLPTDEELEFYEHQKDLADAHQVLDFWRELPDDVKSYLKDLIAVLKRFPLFLQEVIYNMVGIPADDLLLLMHETYLTYCSKDMYGLYYNVFSEADLLLLSQLSFAAVHSAGVSDLTLKEGDLIYRVIESGKYDRDIFKESSCEPHDFSEVYLIECYENSKMNPDEFVFFLSVFAVLEKADWLMLHNAFTFSKMHDRHGVHLVNGRWFASDEEMDLLEKLKACQWNAFGR